MAESSKRTQEDGIDTDVFDCHICFDTLTIPFFQCENGHLACSSCCTKLKNMCPSCSFSIGYNRFRAIEKVLEADKVPHNAGANKRMNSETGVPFSPSEKRTNTDGGHVESGSTSALPSANPVGTMTSSAWKRMPPPLMASQRISGIHAPISSPAELQGLAASQQDNAILGNLGKEELGAMALNSGLQATFFTRLLWDQCKLLEEVVSKKTSELEAANKRIIALDNELGTRIKALEAAKQRNTELEKRLRNDKIWSDYREAQLCQKYENELYSSHVALKAERAKVAELKKTTSSR
ncbi:E3 ubiquitin-protein ligase SIN-like [Trema orientale]|uniref:E3 ubiquitin-protein ligase SIN-like n=1 Tax=Trema orientale TaxID=63057 RepID=A0A2P5CBS4_TREOI|nr:E3 ubiquitin-protein ligase SIN-like [Trema orientale]